MGILSSPVSCARERDGSGVVGARGAAAPARTGALRFLAGEGGSGAAPVCGGWGLGGV